MNWKEISLILKEAHYRIFATPRHNTITTRNKHRRLRKVNLVRDMITCKLGALHVSEWQ